MLPKLGWLKNQFIVQKGEEEGAKKLLKRLTRLPFFSDPPSGALHKFH